MATASWSPPISATADAGPRTAGRYGEDVGVAMTEYLASRVRALLSRKPRVLVAVDGPISSST